MRITPGRRFTTHSLLLACCILAAGCSHQQAAPTVAYPTGGQTVHNIDVEPGMSAEAKSAAKQQLQQMQQTTQKR